MEKSSIFFSKNVSLDLKDQICREMDGIQMHTKSKYLGLPLVVGRSKNQVLNYVVEAADCKIQGWKHKCLSTAGKEVLLKSVVMALPNYIMSCYRLPNTLCKKIEKRMAFHWWGGKGDKRKIHSAKWDRLTGSKMSGGLGFRDLNAVKDALLAKQIWRLLQEPHLLMSKVLKERYFPNCDFLQTQIKEVIHGYGKVGLGLSSW